jgi:hypothetical protein
MAKEYKHITEEQRKLAEKLWRDFNAKLKENGMDLFYDCEMGRFYVASDELGPGYIKNGTETGETAADLDRDELEKVVAEGEFTGVPNNPPWFSDGTGYTLRVKG